MSGLTIDTTTLADNLSYPAYRLGMPIREYVTATVIIYLKPKAWTPLLLTIRFKVEAFVKASFNAVLVNYYRDGEDHVGWHADDEAELGERPLIASLSFGAARRFDFKAKNGSDSGDILLQSGTLLIMQPAFQHNYLHRIPKSAAVINGRINLTFRQVVMTSNTT